MTHRHPRLRAVGLTVAISTWPLLSIAVVGQAPSSDSHRAPSAAPRAKENAERTKKPWTVPRTPWGDPDLQGTWSYATLTPLERPASMAEREFLTDDEIAARDAESTVDAPPKPGDTGTYNSFWFDRGH